jgi:peroxiredoxin
LAVLAAEVLGDPDPVLATAAPAGVAVWQLREPHQQVVQSLPVAPAPAPPATVPLTAQQLAESKARAKLIADVPVAPGEPRDQADGDAIAAQLIGKPLPFDLVVDGAGRTLDLRALRGKKVLIAVLRGFLGEICLYCTAMSAMLTDQREKLADEGVAVLLVYPGEAEIEPRFWRLYAEEFAEVPPPYHVVYDADLRITAELGIESDLAYPTTLLINEQGIVTYAAVAASGTDRNGTAALRKAIDSL